jgi:hypothetical protein
MDIDPKGAEARTLRFAGARGMVASGIMMIILVWQKVDAVPAILISSITLTVFQLFVARRGLKRVDMEASDYVHTSRGELPVGKQRRHRPTWPTGSERALDEARQRGIVELVYHLWEDQKLTKFNVERHRIYRLVGYTYGIQPDLWPHEDEEQHEHLSEPTVELDGMFQFALSQEDEVLRTIEHYSHIGIFTFIDKFHINWVNGSRDTETVKRSMVRLLFLNNSFGEVWKEYDAFTEKILPEPIWQFSRQRYFWAKDQWPNLSDRITTIWTLQDLGLLKESNTDAVLEKLGVSY